MIATISFLTSRACVPCSGSLGIDRESFPIRTCVRLRWRAHGEINPDLNRTRNPASHQSASQPLPAVGKMPATIEHTQPIALVARAISHELRLEQRKSADLDHEDEVQRQFTRLLAAFERIADVMELWADQQVTPC